MIDLLKLAPKHGHLKLQEAVESALAGSCFDAAAVHPSAERRGTAASIV